MLRRCWLMLLLFSTLTAAVPAAAEPQSFRVKVTGKGRPMILIPGLSCSGEVWNTTVAHYRNRFQCHVLTVAGFAGVPRVPAPVLETVRKDLTAYIRERKLDKPVIVGHSMGGLLALLVATREPEIAGPLVIVDMVPFVGATQNPAMTADRMKPMAERMRASTASQPPDKYAETARGFFRPMVASPKDLETILSWAARSDPTAVGDAMYEIFTTDLREDCARITSPTLVLASWVAYKERSTREQVESNFRLGFSKLKGAKISMSDTARHFIMQDDPKWFFAEVDAFLGLR